MQDALTVLLSELISSLPVMQEEAKYSSLRDQWSLRSELTLQCFPQ